MPASLPPLTLILGGARSGKSGHAERLVLESGLEPCYLATGRPGDAEMAARIATHRARRSAAWRVVEEPLELTTALEDLAGAGRAVLVDCLTLWVTNLLLAKREIEAETDGLLAVLPALQGPVVFVSNEVGLGIVPIDALTRAFVDATGTLHQRLAALADQVELVAAGLPLRLKPER